MIIASWLLAVDPQRVASVRAALAAAPGREIRDKKGSRFLVLLTESALDVPTLRQELLATPGVESAEAIAFFDDREPTGEVSRCTGAIAV